MGAGDLQYKRWHFYKDAKWSLKFVWWPVRCDKSKKLLWMTRAYKGINSFDTLVDAGMYKIKLCEVRWLTKQEFIFGTIAGTL